MLLPGELLRLIFALLSLGMFGPANEYGYGFSMLPNNLYLLTYLKWFNRNMAVYHGGERIFGDYAAYFLCYVLCLVIHLLGIFLIFRFFWKKEKMRQDDFVFG